MRRSEAVTEAGGWLRLAGPAGSVLRILQLVGVRRVTGLSVEVIAELVAEVGPLWHERHQAKLTSRPRKWAVGAGAKHKPRRQRGAAPVDA
ncbi:hypothetical protein CA983_33375 [Streptomyces swartbergensis]|uniref:Uncharacterized protein n=1 Tax=Streptomyces swartbergensis TaxID=487165 RepID=A0A243RKP3_9ACTN|nr:hypothetical protein CA983_33375 [Streptomyces swartbergensis]